MRKRSDTVVAFVGFVTLLAACEPEVAQETKNRSVTASGNAYEVTLTWNAAEDSVNSYRVYLGESQDAQGSILTSVDVSTAGFDATSPKLVLPTDQHSTLAEFIGQEACFALTAVTKNGVESDRSSVVCTKL